MKVRFVYWLIAILSAFVIAVFIQKSLFFASYDYPKDGSPALVFYLFPTGPYESDKQYFIPMEVNQADNMATICTYGAVIVFALIELIGFQVVSSFFRRKKEPELVNLEQEKP